ncbi:MAG TPA: hypothetical protein VLE73_02440 [Candidatus Saccharimonadales bacterium]|nr:hypothetical protein [Candidatus Saccharimonadales bacterium]
MPILEAHPDNEHFGLFFVGRKREVKRLNQTLLAATLGTLAAAANGAEASVDVEPLLHHVVARHAQGELIASVSRELATAVGAVLGAPPYEGDPLVDRLELLVRQTTAGHLTTVQLLQEAKILKPLIENGPPWWLTHEGLCASWVDGQVVPDFGNIQGDRGFKAIGKNVVRIAQEVGADTYTYQMPVSNNTPYYTARPSISSDERLVLGLKPPTALLTPS